MGVYDVRKIANPEFVNLKPTEINPLMSLCDIKVMYLGKNRNGSFIDKTVATEMSKTLRGAPIVGWYKEENEDFRDHGDVVTIDGDGVSFNKKTKPYGFVSPDAEVWFQKFEEKDVFGNLAEREYLMTNGYLWTGQFTEAKCILEDGRPQSMELDEETLSGKWANDSKSGYEFFIINDAIFSALCVLGKDVEPCFEGASIEPISTSFANTNANSVQRTLFSMMQDLHSVLNENKNKGEINMSLEPEVINPTEPVVVPVDPTPVEPTVVEPAVEPSTTEPVAVDPTPTPVEPVVTESVVESTEYVELQQKYSLLEAELETLKQEKEALIQFKKEVELKQKDDLINSFYMLSDEDKKDVIENKANYSLDDIEAKLSIICVKNKVNFDKTDTQENNNNIEDLVTFSLADTDPTVPAWLAAVERNKNKNI